MFAPGFDVGSPAPPEPTRHAPARGVLTTCFVFIAPAQVRRRLPKRVYVPLPDGAGRQAIIEHLLRSQPSKLSRWDLQRIVGSTEG